MASQLKCLRTLPTNHSNNLWPCQTGLLIWLFWDKCQVFVTLIKIHDDVIKWKNFPRNSVNSPHKGQWRAALMFTLICVWINGCVNNREAGDLRRYYAHYGVTVMWVQKNRSIAIKSYFTLQNARWTASFSTLVGETRPAMELSSLCRGLK